MKVRLILLAYEDEILLINGYLNEKSFPDFWSERIMILNHALNEDDIDIVITPHNFFTLIPYCICQANEYLIHCGLLHELNTLSNKKPIILGVDLVNNHIPFNPYFSLDAIVYFLDLNGNNEFTISTAIWECWKNRDFCNQTAFIEQNRKRVIPMGDKDGCLLSCGDIMAKCHSSGDKLPDTDIYVALTHKDFKKWLVQKKVKDKDVSNINYWKQDDELIVLVTQNIAKSNIQDRNFFKDFVYQLIWPVECRHGSNTIFYDKKFTKLNPKTALNNINYIFIDLVL